MPDCAACPIFHLEAEGNTCLHVNRPGGLALTKRGIELSGLSVGARVLDVASGAGATLDYLVNELGMDALGLDASADMLHLSREQSSIARLIRADGGRIPLADGSQQAVVMECALSLVGNIGAILKEYQRIISPGGSLIVTDIYLREVIDPSVLSCLSSTHCLAGALTEEEIRREITASDFQIRIWQDETLLFKQWLVSIIFKLGSLQNFYRQLVTCDNDTDALYASIGSKIKLGYYLMIAERGTV